MAACPWGKLPELTPEQYEALVMNAPKHEELMTTSITWSTNDQGHARGHSVGGVFS